MLSQSTLASGVFELRLQRSQRNAPTVDRSGSCCKNRNGECAADCNVYFRICLKHFQTYITPDPPCTFGSVQVPPMLSADVTEKITTLPFPFKFKWPVSRLRQSSQPLAPTYRKDFRDLLPRPIGGVEDWPISGAWSTERMCQSSRSGRAVAGAGNLVQWSDEIRQRGRHTAKVEESHVQIVTWKEVLKL